MKTSWKNWKNSTSASGNRGERSLIPNDLRRLVPVLCRSGRLRGLVPESFGFLPRSKAGSRGYSITNMSYCERCNITDTDIVVVVFTDSDGEESQHTMCSDCAELYDDIVFEKH